MIATASPPPDATVPGATVFDAAWQEAAYAGLSPTEVAVVQDAQTWMLARLADGRMITGEPLDSHAAGLAVILASMQVDGAARAAAFIATALADEPLPVPGRGKDPLVGRFDAEIARLVQGYRSLIRLGQVTRDADDHGEDRPVQAEMLRKMLLAMAADLRIVLMRLASRLQTLRWHAACKTKPDPVLVQESLDLYAPLANRLGVWQVKWELEDLAFRFQQPQAYKEVAGLLESRRAGREALITYVTTRLRQSLDAAGIVADVSGRPKHIYSIWNKMRVKGLAFSELFDLHALRVIVADERACYAVLGLVHELWTPLPEEFDDYITRPKPNGYRSLHTVVRDEQDRVFEVQIRTQEMHRFAEFGVAAHWRYKEAGARGGSAEANSEYDRRLAWLRQLLAWGTDSAGKGGVLATTTAIDDQIYVLTPQARVVELPAGATPVDFAYYVHTDLGHRCRGARVDGHMVPLNTRLATGQTVEIITAKSGGPSRDWLNPQLGYLAGARPRAKVRQWFNAIEVQQRIANGHALVEKELQRLGKTATNLEQLAQQLGFARADDLYIAIAKDEFSLRQIGVAFQAPAEPEEDERDEIYTHARRAESVEKSGKSGVLVVGVDSLLTQLARCCRPAPPDPISGFVTKGRGVSIHRADCTSFAALAQRHAERVIDVAWGTATTDTLYPVDVLVTAQDRAGLLRDLSEVFARLRLNVVGVNTLSRQSLARMVFTLEVGNGQQLGKALTALREVSGVIDTVRK